MAAMKNCILAGDMFEQVAVFKILGITFDLAEALHPIMTELEKFKKGERQNFGEKEAAKLVKDVKVWARLLALYKWRI